MVEDEKKLVSALSSDGVGGKKNWRGARCIWSVPEELMVVRMGVGRKSEDAACSLAISGGVGSMGMLVVVGVVGVKAFVDVAPGEFVFIEAWDRLAMEVSW